MMRVTTLYAGSAAATARYYTKYLTQAPGEEPGRWTGTQAAALGLAGEVSTDALEVLLSGCDPLTGATLGNPAKRRWCVVPDEIDAVTRLEPTRRQLAHASPRAATHDTIIIRCGMSSLGTRLTLRVRYLPDSRGRVMRR